MKMLRSCFRASPLAAPFACAVVAAVFLPLACGSPSHSEEITAETIDAWMTDLSNWGRWGDEDQLGALKLIAPDKRRQAAALVEHGISVSLAHDTIKELAPDVTSPFQHEVPTTGADAEGSFSVDTYSVLYHGYAHSHIDALCHMWGTSEAYPGVMYNGFGKDTVTEAGCGKLGIGVIAREGHATAAGWLKERDVAALGSDAASDLLPSGVPGVTHPVHLLVIVAMGMPIFDNADLKALAEEAARLERWEFLLTAAPVRVPGGTGSPLNAIATF